MTTTAVAAPEHGRDDLSPEKLSRLLEVSQSLGSTLDLKQILATTVDAACALLDTEMSTLMLLDEEEQVLEVEAHAGISSSLARRLSTPLGANLAGRAGSSRAPVRTSDVTRDERSELGDVCAGHIRAALLVPLIRNGNLLGVLGVEASEAREFGDADEGVLLRLADQAAAAIETARAYAVEHDQVEQLRALLERTSVQNDAMRRSREAHNRLAETALEGSGLQTLLHVLVELVPVPAALVNQFGVRLCGDAPAGREDAERLWDECRESAGFGRDLERLRQSGGFVRPAPSESGFWRIVGVCAGGEVLGALVVLDHSALEEQHVLILEEAASIVAAELLRERSVAEAEARSHGDLMQALMSADAEAAGLGERAALLGHDLSEEQAVVAVSPAGEDSLPAPAAITSAGRRAVARVGLRGLFGVVGESAAILLSAGDRSLCRDAVERWVAAFQEELRGRAEDVELHFGVSEVPCPGDEVQEGFAHSRQAATMCRLGEDCSITFFEDVQLIATLIDITNDEAIERYIERTIGRLEEYDGRKHTYLAQTLETYLDCSGVTRHAAKALYLHPHSLRYRLRRIAEIQGIDLEDPMARLTSHVALKLRAIISPAPAAATDG